MTLLYNLIKNDMEHHIQLLTLKPKTILDWVNAQKYINQMLFVYPIALPETREKEEFKQLINEYVECKDKELPNIVTVNIDLSTFIYYIENGGKLHSNAVLALIMSLRDDALHYLHWLKGSGYVFSIHDLECAVTRSRIVTKYILSSFTSTHNFSLIELVISAARSNLDTLPLVLEKINIKPTIGLFKELRIYDVSIQSFELVQNKFKDFYQENIKEIQM